MIYTGYLQNTVNHYLPGADPTNEKLMQIYVFVEKLDSFGNDGKDCYKVVVAHGYPHIVGEIVWPGPSGLKCFADKL